MKLNDNFSWEEPSMGDPMSKSLDLSRGQEDLHLSVSNPTYCGYSDESSWNQNQYRSIAFVTGPTSRIGVLDSAISKILDASEIREFGWKKVTSAKYRFAAVKIYNVVVNMMREQDLRVDVLTWDTQDSRHDIQGRNDSVNFVRMYYHLLSNVINMRWGLRGMWRIYADERTDVDWELLEDCLCGQTKRQRADRQQVFKGLLPIRTSKPPQIEQVSSSSCLLVQVADLFAGVSAFSWNQRSEHRVWSEEQTGQQTLFRATMVANISRTSQHKHEVLDHITRRESRGLGPRIEPGKGLKTLNPQLGLNFWLYLPQSPMDRAPHKNRLKG